MPSAFPENPKLMTLEQAVERRGSLPGKLALTNGCFDLLHAGHLSFLSQAARQGAELWVALNGDASVRALKGPHRPILPEAERAYALAALESVSGILIFQTPRLDAEIRALKPDLYLKAGDYNLDTLHPEERNALEAAGSEIRFLPFLPGFSTTDAIARIRSLPQ